MKERWIPNIEDRQGPRYRAITDALAEDIGSHRLQPGALLPPHRLLASQLGVTVGTITRAYAEAKRRGLIAGEVGRGTFVLGTGHGADKANRAASLAADIIDLKLNQPAIDDKNPILNDTLKELSKRRDLHALLDYQSAPGKEHHRLAGAKWVAKAGVAAGAHQIVICNGVQQALMAAFATLTKPGDLVLTEALNYAGVRRLASMFHVKLLGVAMDQLGVQPDALEEACARQTIAMIVLTPTIHNPTAITLPLDRRKQIVEIAARRNIPIVEDDTYGQLPMDRSPPLYSLAKDNCVYLSGTSKSLLPGLRVAYLVAPEQIAYRFAEAVHVTTWTTSSLAAEIAALWINNGTADEYIAWHRQEIAVRQNVAYSYLSRIGNFERTCSYHIWLPLPEYLRADEVTVQAQAAGVAIAPSSVFAVEPRFAVQAVRISLGGPPSIESLETGLQRLVGVLERNSGFRQMIV